MSQSLFLTISVLGLLAALGTVLARNLVHAALYLVAFFFIVACQFVMLEAEFLAAIQVLVYIGAVAILLMFGIMLTRNVQGDDTTTVPRGWIVPALVATLGMFFVLAFGINNHVGLRGHSAWSATVRRPPVGGEPRRGEVPTARTLAVNAMGKTVGDEMLTRYAVPFEVAGLMLTAALVGAIALAHRDEEDENLPRRGGPAARVGALGNGDALASATAETDATTITTRAV
ncbi:MAG: NADH-quinone oxidoreductase subunit J [Planctomycetia bacterium]|nr:NADH-quinone oxidoreductase subunit J [Planctomycetia bacterium]